MQPYDIIRAYGITSNSQLRQFAKTADFVINDINYAEDIDIDRDGAYIINLGDKEIGGTHWTALWIDGRDAFYFDSFGVPMEDILIDKLKAYGIKQLWYNHGFEFQRLDQQLCGLWCLMFFHYMRNNTELSLNDRFKKMAERYIDTL